MRWVIYFLLSLPVAVLGLLSGGFIGDACVRWYRVSSFEGGSGYMVIFLALLGAIIGLITGLITIGVMAPQGGVGHLKAFGASVGVLACLALIITGTCWFFADIPPEIDCRPLTLEIELRLPANVTQSPAEGTGDSSLDLHSVVNHVARAQESGTLRPKDARLENGRWIVPGEVGVFTMRGLRSLDFRLNGEVVQGFIVPLPARPGKEYLEWSDWGPRPPAPLPPWPDTKASYRFRVQKVPAPPPDPTPEEREAEAKAQGDAAFAAIPPGSPIPDWFPYLHDGARADQRATAITKLTAKPTFLAEMRTLMVDDNARHAEAALRLLSLLPQHPPELLESVANAGRDLAERIRKVNETTTEQDPHYQGAADVSIRFGGWMEAVRTLRTKAGGDFTPELKTILELSRVRPDSNAMRGDVCRVASYYMREWAGLEPLPTDPPPR